ncbi:uncharacterized protein LOC125241522 [Leguminivora glycinivorella]|uniref:uncharacterized protein LOC125241522 n=1 Tax=Leguminivora glycinivorella TaxID=1035111 RepID=UPI00200CF071|nr:uncharacterized protein LOC125241522 [Leguminivora glycinivorella]
MQSTLLLVWLVCFCAADSPNYDNTHFCPIPEMAQQGATEEPESQHPWLVRVVHAPSNATDMAPLICTGAVLADRVYITAARCIFSAKADYTTVIYSGHQLSVKAFVFPAQPTNQMFDDVGFIVSWWKREIKSFHTITLALERRLDDNSFDFFDDLAVNDSTLLGFIASKDSPSTHTLYRLDNMHASNEVCHELYPSGGGGGGAYRVPCAHSCRAAEQRAGSAPCGRLLLGLGHVLVDRSARLLGLVTWSCANAPTARRRSHDMPLPLGLALPNTKASQLNYDCAIAIRNLKVDYDKLTRGTHKSACDNIYNAAISG